MNLTDILALAKQGYKPSDIKELISIADVGADDGADDVTDTGNKNEMEQLVEQLKKQNKDLQDALKRMDLSEDKETESAFDILKETLTSLF